MDAKCFYSERDSAWVVEAIDFDNEGVAHRALFTGVEAEERAAEYAAWKYDIKAEPQGQPALRRSAA